MTALRRLSADLMQLRDESAGRFCRNYWTCPKFCDLCANNPNKRCEADGGLAPKHLENAKLETDCGAPLLANLCCFELFQGEQSGSAIGFEKSKAQQLYVEVSRMLLNLLATFDTADYMCSLELE